MKNINIKFTINTLEDFHIGSGLEKIGVYDDGQYKDENNKPSIKNETFKGLLKQSCREIKNILYDKEEGKNLFNMVFNFEGQNSIDAKINLDEEHYKGIDNPFVIHTFTSVEQKTKRAKDSSLHNIEFASKGIKFSGKINFLVKDDSKVDKIKEFLEKGLKNLKWWGGYRRRGFGAIKISDIKFDINEIESSSNTDNNITNKLSLILELKEDVTIAGKASAGNIIETLDYIPATSILGMTRFVLMSNQTEIFNYLDDSKIKVSNFYPVPNKKDFKIKIMKDKFEEIHTAFISPIPLSLRQNKATEIEFGSKFEKEKIPHWALKTKDKKTFAEMLRQDSLIDNNSASQDDGSDKSFSGGYIYTPSDKLDKNNILINSTYTKVKTELSMRNHIDTKKQSSKKTGGLFSQEKIKKGTRFKGQITFDNENDAKKFKEHFDNYLNDKRNFHVGRGGKPIEVIDYKFLPDGDTSKASVSFNKNSNNEFTITCISDVILFDKDLNRVKSLTTEILANKLGIESNKLILKSKVDSTRIIQNYNGLSGLRRFSDIAIKKGSAYSFEYTGSEDILTELNNLEKKGLGIRTFEGFGDIKVNYAIHFADFKLNSENNKRSDNKLSAVRKSKISKHYTKNLKNNYEIYRKVDIIYGTIKKMKSKSVVNRLISKLEASSELTTMNTYLQHNIDRTDEAAKDYKIFKNNWNSHNFRNLREKVKILILALEKVKNELSKKGGNNE